MPTIVCIDANIGAGKSTLLAKLAERGCTVLQEGVEHWGDILQRFYHDPARWAFSLQVAIALDMARQYDKMSSMVEEEVVFVERGPHSAMCFVRNSVQAGHMDQEELKLYTKMHNVLGWKPDVLVVIDVDTNTCLQRIKQRNRAGEDAIDLNYLVAIDTEHKKMISALSDTTMSIIRLDGRKSPDVLVKDVLDAFRTL